MVSGLSSGYDRHITIFSPEGRLYQIEYAMNAVKNTGLTSIAVRGDDSVVLVTQKKVPDKLIDPSSVRHMFSVTKNIGCVVTGLQADAMYLLKRARYEAAEFKFKKGHNISCYYLAKRMANLAQLCTQHAYMRTLGVVMIYASFEENGPELYRCDPSGIFNEYKACSAGLKEQEATSLLETFFKESPEMTFDNTIKVAIQTLQKVAGSDLKSDEIEVAVIDKNGFKVYNETEIDQRITLIHESME